MKNLQTEHLNAYDPLYLSYRNLQDLQPCYRDEVYVLCRHLMQLRSISYPAHVEMMGLIGAGNNPMVGMTVSVAVSIEEAAKAGKF